ncbi:MAG: amidase [Rhodospirillales bacterium]|nr:amidase [Rhodospirillales bacterium]
MNPHELSLAQAALEIREGRLKSAELVRSCLDRIAAVDKDVQAWRCLDPEHAMRQAEELDSRRSRGQAVGRLHGIPVGIKDLFDTADYPTEYGSPIYAGHAPRRDAACVASLRAAGAVILGKTVTTEFAYFFPGKTRNPHDPKRTPGGSSSGSAAAVAAIMVPGAIGTQTNGSVIRPASYCGVVGFKPTHGLIPRTGAFLLSRTLDHVGTFARTIEDAALLAEIMAGHDEDDPDTRSVAIPPLAQTAAENPPLPPRFAFVKTPVWNQAEPTTHAAFAELVNALGDATGEVELPMIAREIVAMHQIVMDVEMARNLHREYEKARDKLSRQMRELLERGRKHLAFDYRRAVDMIEPINATVDAVFDEYDAILTPATTGEAPVGLDATGSPVFCTIWTYLGLPAVTLPLLTGPNGLPVGVQLVGRRGNDARLLRTARWLAATLSGKRPGTKSKSAKPKKGRTP